MEKGTVVEFFSEKRITCGVCLEEKGKKLHLLTEGNREVSLSPSRLNPVSPSRLSPSASRDQLVAELKRIAATREALKEAVQPEELWELLQQEEESYDCRTLAGFCFEGEITPDHESAVFRALHADRIYFKRKGDRFVPNPPAVVEQMLLALQRDQEREQELTAGAAWIREVWAGERQDIPPDLEPLVALLQEVAIYGEESSRYSKAKALLSRAGLPPTAATAFQLLIKLGLWDEDENLLLHRYRLQEAFPAPVLEAAAEASRRLSEEGEIPRRDLRSLSLLTIDSATTRDIDDALSIEKAGEDFVVGVHIADVSHFVLPDDPVDQEARERATSLYLPDQKIPMLPPLLSEEVCSLTAGQERLAMSLLVRITPEGEVATYEIVPSRICVQRQLTYQEVDARLEEDPELALLLELSQLLRQKRVESGALLLPIPQLEISVDEEKNIFLEKIERETPSQIIVSELMILANWLAAHFCHLHHAPAIYRGQNAPSGDFTVSETYDPVLHYRQR
ncbi:MAG: RNB domain-containing ribonuclease, partial [Nitrospinota bacterium]